MAALYEDMGQDRVSNKAEEVMRNGENRGTSNDHASILNIQIPIRPNGETIIDERRVLSPFLITSALTLDQVILMAVEGDDEESSGYACVVESDTAILVHTTRNSWGDTELFSSVRLIPKPTSALPGSRAIQQEL
uniref:Uncharacterized protein n=1 Tax=Moniliophthora roreri TaxID=221103 RepID=A0A0W0FZZ9_MONRR